MLRLKRDVEVFENLEDLVDDVSRKFSPNVKLYNVKNLFSYFCIFLLLISIVFVMHVLLSRQLQTINRKLLLLLGYRYRAIGPAELQRSDQLFSNCFL